MGTFSLYRYCVLPLHRMQWQELNRQKLDQVSQILFGKLSTKRKVQKLGWLTPECKVREQLQLDPVRSFPKEIPQSKRQSPQLLPR